MSTPRPLTPQKPLPSGRRIIALWFPHWAAEMAPAMAAPDEPFALIDKHKNAQILVALNRAAHEAGLHPAMSLADARALVPTLHTAMADAAQAKARLEKCAHWLQRYTPWVGHDSTVETPHQLPEYGLLMDVSGCAHLFGGERALLEDMAARFGAYGKGRAITMRAAMAGTIGAAWGLARFSPTQLSVLPEGQEAEAVLRLPPAALRLTRAHSELCQRLGLETVEQLARFPRRDLTRRFGPLPVMRLEQALGQAGESLNPCLPPPQFRVQKNLPHGLTQIEALAAVLGGLCERLAAQLQDAGQGAQRLDLVLTRSDNAVMALSLRLAHPSADAMHMARLFDERLGRLTRGIDAGYGIEQIKLLASRTAPVQMPQEAINLSGHLAGRLRKTAPVAALGHFYDRLISRLGPHAVLRPLPEASHIPERAVRLVSVLDTAVPPPLLEAVPDPKTRPLFMLCAPEPIEVIAEIPEGAPYRFRWRRVLHEVIAAHGPERISPEWWAGFMGDTQNTASHTRLNNRHTRDYYRVEDRQGHRFWLYRDGLYERETNDPRWFMHGVFP